METTNRQSGIAPVVIFLIVLVLAGAVGGAIPGHRQLGQEGTLTVTE